ncbi:hypothetical protein ABZ726_35495, partial [Streptomyces hundungensis]|uniref:hypothetical protein n=1 Tax=Streptomyces hundungensis TaxID=1077946 RepID=UPI0033DA35F4
MAVTPGRAARMRRAAALRGRGVPRCRPRESTPCVEMKAEVKNEQVVKFTFTKNPNYQGDV